MSLIWAVADDDRGRVAGEVAAIYTRLLLKPICDRQNSRRQELRSHGNKDETDYRSSLGYEVVIRSMTTGSALPS